MRIRELQQRIADALNGLENLVQGGCKALAEDTLNIMTEVELQLAKAGGIAIVVTTPEFTRNGCAASGIQVETTLDVNCIEVVATNREEGSTNMTALDAAETVALSLGDGNIQFESISQTGDERSGIVTAKVRFKVCINLS